MVDLSGIGSCVGLGRGNVDGAPRTKYIFAFASIESDVTGLPDTCIREAKDVCMKSKHALEQ
jgi:hypothetical protein